MHACLRLAPTLFGTTDAGDKVSDFLVELALAGLCRGLFEGVGEHHRQTEHLVFSLNLSL